VLPALFGVTGHVSLPLHKPPRSINSLIGCQFQEGKKKAPPQRGSGASKPVWRGSRSPNYASPHLPCGSYRLVIITNPDRVRSGLAKEPPSDTQRCNLEGRDG
jgi:hypothetical protein